MIYRGTELISERWLEQSCRHPKKYIHQFCIFTWHFWCQEGNIGEACEGQCRESHLDNVFSIVGIIMMMMVLYLCCVDWVEWLSGAVCRQTHVLKPSPPCIHYHPPPQPLQNNITAEYSEPRLDWRSSPQSIDESVYCKSNGSAIEKYQRYVGCRFMNESAAHIHGYRPIGRGRRNIWLIFWWTRVGIGLIDPA